MKGTQPTQRKESTTMVIEIELGVLKLELDKQSLDELDVKLDAVMRAKQREAFAGCLRKIEAAEETRSCTSCQGQMTSRGLITRTIGMLSGDVKIARRRLRCGLCGHESYPLDGWMREGKHTLALVERALFLATEFSYKKASEVLLKLTGAKISHGQLQALAKREGSLVGRDLERMASDLFGLGLDPGEIVTRTKNDTLVIAIDGGTIPDRETKGDFEAKVGVVYGLKAQVSKGRVALVDRVAYAGLDTAFEFGKKLFCLARRHGVLSAGRVLVISDGAPWIKNVAVDFFPQAVYLLDLYHLKRRLRELLTGDADELLYEEICKACVRGDPEEALVLLSRFEPKNDEQAEKLRRLKGYVRSNRKGIANYVRSDLFGSGAVEKAVDLIVSRRFKARGMSWLRPGASGMLKLRLLRFNGSWNDHWLWRLETQSA